MSPAALKSAESIAGYTLRERIGSGGYGEVWRAEAPGGLAKAVKFVYGCLDERRAACEFKALHRIKEVRHPFLLSLERIEVVDGQLVIVTELADQSLQDRFEESRAAGQPGIPRDELLGYLRDAADALDFMSAKHGLQHLDIKPENLLIVGGRMKVADFGLVKDLEDVSVSLVGGMTPDYAAPEVFDGRPSPHSDQYSLAIVYQEMLTGVLPFPGKTPAQLAAQHLNSRPRLLPLPARDHAAVAKALAKSPEQRFPSCRAMVDALGQTEATTRERGPGCSPDESKPPEGRSDTAPAALGTVPTQGDPGSAPLAPGARPPSATLKTMMLDSPSGPSAPAGDVAPDPEALPIFPHPLTGTSPSAPVEPFSFPEPILEAIEDLPPLDLTGQKPRLSPLLVIGVGGFGGEVLKQFRRRMASRFGDPSDVPIVRTVLLDTDASAVWHATQGDQSAALPARDAIALPLRHPQEYRDRADDHLQWLSRRWLYNIPRSLQTEGLRPLGRLALLDHAREVFAHLRGASAAILAPDALSRAAERSPAGLRGGLEVAASPARVILVGSISGGTGSGMMINLAYAVRSVLEQSSAEGYEIAGILARGAGRGGCGARSTAGRDLATANACACLVELQHSHRQGVYHGDPAWALSSTVAGSPAFDDLSFLDLGSGLDPDQWSEAAAWTAERVFFDTASAAGPFFGECRRVARREAVPRHVDLTVGSFSLCHVGPGEDDGDTRLAAFVRSAMPAVAPPGSGRALLLVTPPGPHSLPLSEALAHAAGIGVSRAHDGDNRCVVCGEALRIPVSRILVGLLDARPDCADLACRLHTRRDIAWPSIRELALALTAAGRPDDAP